MPVRSRSRSRSMKKKPLLGLLVAVLVIGAGFAMYMAFGRDNKSGSAADTTTPATAAETPDTSLPEDNGPPVTPEDQHNVEQKNPGTPINPAPSPAPEPVQKVRVAISRVESNGTVTATLDKSGTCTAVFTKGNQRVTGSATAQIQTSYYACKINMSASQFPQAGQWNVTVTAKSGSATGSASATANIVK